MLINNLFKCTQEEFDLTKSREKVKLICSYCEQEYIRTKKEILDTFKKNRKTSKILFHILS